jgi:hypothetical protein
MVNDYQKNYNVFLEPIFDRFLETKLEKAYNILVPHSIHRIGKPSLLKGEADENSCNIRPSFIGQTKRRDDYCQPNRGIGGVCKKRKA